MKVYLASSRENIALVKEYASKLVALGHVITYAWWLDVEQLGNDDGVSDEDAARCANADETGVRVADVFWLLAPEKGGTGCWIELGMAIGHFIAGADKSIVISGAFDRTIFSSLMEVEETFAHHERAFEFVTCGATEGSL